MKRFNIIFILYIKYVLQFSNLAEYEASILDLGRFNRGSSWAFFFVIILSQQLQFSTFKAPRTDWWSLLLDCILRQGHQVFCVGIIYNEIVVCKIEFTYPYWKLQSLNPEGNFKLKRFGFPLSPPHRLQCLRRLLPRSFPSSHPNAPKCLAFAVLGSARYK